MNARAPEPRRSPSRAKFEVRELRWSDFAELRDLYYLLYEERGTQPDIGITLFTTRPSPEDEVEWFSKLYQSVLAGESIAVVAERDGHAVGNCVVRRTAPSELHESSHVGLLGIVVHRDHRGAGVGRALLAKALQECRGRFEIVRLSVFSVNVRARRLYEEFGFVFIGTVPGVVRRGPQRFDEDLMVLDLTKPSANG